jgi:hypothetical protein
MTDEQLAKVKASVKEAMKEELGDLFIERERHYKDHEFITGVRVMREKVEGHACKVVTNGGLTGLGLLILWGVYRFIESISARVKF